MPQRVNACVNFTGASLSRDNLTGLRRDTADLFNVGKANMIEQRRVQWTTNYNLNLWFSTWKNTLIDLGFGRKATTDDDVRRGRDSLL